MIAVPNYISPQEYLAIERQSQNSAMNTDVVWFTQWPAARTITIAFAFNSLKVIWLTCISDDSTDCRFYSGNVKVNYQDQFYYYPDAFVTCDPRGSPRYRYLKRYPKLIAEVFPQYDAAFDKGEKFQDYQQIETLEEYD
ncbi:MAG UNVERIFIED_CONTAM: Uma2 family endonuclease [Microcystis novacekii LVE1205-3]|jgi:hypothetical protein